MMKNYKMNIKINPIIYSRLSFKTTKKIGESQAIVISKMKHSNLIKIMNKANLKL